MYPTYMHCEVLMICTLFVTLHIVLCNTFLEYKVIIIIIIIITKSMPERQESELC